MAAKLLILAALVACANAGYLSLGYGGNGQGGQAGNNNGGYSGGSNAGSNGGNNGLYNGNSNYYNNAPLALSHGPLPQSNPQPVVAPLRYAPNPPPLATSASFRHQISHSQPAQLQVSSSYNAGYGYGNLGNLGNQGGYGGSLGNGNNNAGYNNGYGGYGYNDGLNGGNGNNGNNNYGGYGNRGY